MDDGLAGQAVTVGEVGTVWRADGADDEGVDGELGGRAGGEGQ